MQSQMMVPGFSAKGKRLADDAWPDAGNSINFHFLSSFAALRMTVRWMAGFSADVFWWVGPGRVAVQTARSNFRVT